MKKPFSLILLTILFTTLFFSPGVSGQESAIKAVTTSTVFADLIKNVGGERVDVISLVGQGVDPHHYEPTPFEARALTDADVFFYNGFGLEIWADRLVTNVGRKDLLTVQLSQDLEPLSGVSFSIHHHDEGDPHFWLDITHAMDYVRVIRDTLISLDPEGEDYYHTLADSYLEELAALDTWFEEQIQRVPPQNRRLVTYHNAFAYLADRYGLEVVGFLVHNPDREPSARDQARLVNEIRALKVPAVFGEAQHNTKFVENIAKEAGVKVKILYSGSLTQEVSTYIDMMKANAIALVEGLK